MVWFDSYKDQLVGFVVETRKGKFKPFIGTCIESDGDDDCVIYVNGSQPPQDTLEAALAFYDPDLAKFKRVFRKPVKPGGEMGHWLLQMVRSEDGVDPRAVEA
ncbi:hypothetical protein [Mesorhizobium sp. M8A.F.Ca.ET.021.01.1.1]|uniref:hypothetical protein n=1 Tax=Mesorhizobium sp. M8A.F.Ca.ET.021.01.1.1 TaxID=2496757 RepID=UPI000FCAB0BB|nr:hypothetical protein [Mesorhizobium sp. M8A.F.Ca.ET.021.01.1.1]RUW56834.1 hypothetical protein EOA36_02220 [Mesorhizobium sp. M8A.F.Ca.ET.021.01.1.1]